MSNRRRLRREQLEYYLTHLILAYRYLIWAVSFLLLAFAIALMLTSPIAGYMILLLVMYLLLLGTWYDMVVLTARLGAWIATLWSQDD
jgi:hypothetical protein